MARMVPSSYLINNADHIKNVAYYYDAFWLRVGPLRTP